MDLKALQDITYGLFIVSSRSGTKFNGQICNTVMQVTAEPARFIIAIHKNNLTHEYIVKSGIFSASILEDSAPMDFIGLFGFKSGREVDKFADVGFKEGITGCPMVTDHTISTVECSVINKTDVGTHTIFAGELVDANVVKTGNPLTYAIYHQVKKGFSPKNAPTFKIFDNSGQADVSGLKTPFEQHK